MKASGFIVRGSGLSGLRIEGFRNAFLKVPYGRNEP